MLMQYEREQIVEYGRKLSESGLCPGTSGNLSILDPAAGTFAISPSGMDYFAVTPEDIVVLDLEAHIVEGTRKPSSEWALHTEVYKEKKGMNAVVHTHSVFCTTFSCLGIPLRAVHFAIGCAGSAEVLCAPYALFGSEELAKTSVRYFAGSKAVLLANHGILCCDSDMASAYSLAKNMEYVAELQYRAMSIGTPKLIPDDEIDKVLEKFRTYGQ